MFVEVGVGIGEGAVVGVAVGWGVEVLAGACVAMAPGAVVLVGVGVDVGGWAVCAGEGVVPAVRETAGVWRESGVPGGGD